MEQLKKDVEFLRDNNSIDYSLLIGIHLIELNKQQSNNINPIKTNQNQSTIIESYQKASLQDKFKNITQIDNTNCLEKKSESKKDSKELLDLVPNSSIKSLNEYNIVINTEIEEDNYNITEKEIHPFNSVFFIIFECSLKMEVLKVQQTKKFII